ncbi:hypothetical protein KW799_01500, partial [Candidatus Parcubacteria bacterium]|nr:hypothetical protein [Candidatus Parcubacteria bacterium]
AGVIAGGILGTIVGAPKGSFKGVGKDIGSAFIKDEGKFKAGEEIGKDAEKEYKKAAGDAVREAKEKFADTDPQLKKLGEEQEQLNKDIRENEGKIPEIVKQMAQRKKDLIEEEKRLSETLKNFAANNAGVINRNDYDTKLKNVQSALVSVKDEIANTDKAIEDGPDAMKDAEKARKTSIENKIKARKDEVAKSVLSKAKDKGVKVEASDENWEGMMRIIKQSDKITGEETAAKLNKLVEDADKPKEAPEPKPEGGEKK